MADTNVFCSQCGTSNLSSARFCSKCGATVTLLGSGTAMTPAAPGAMPAPAAMPAPDMIVSPYGGFWIRFLALFLDSMILGAVTVPIVLIFMGASIAAIAHLGPDPSPEQVFSILVPFFVIVIPLSICLQWLYDAFMTSGNMQATLGKRICGLKVTDMAGNRISFGRATGRHFVRAFISGILCIGFIMAAFTDRKQGLHDMIAGTLVMKR